MNHIVHREFDGDIIARNTILRPIDFTTAGLPARRQFEAFRAAHESIMDICPPDVAGLPFQASQRIWSLDKLVLTCTMLPGDGHGLRWRHWERAALDHWYVVLPCGFAGGRAVPAQPAARPRIHCLASPLESGIEEAGALTLFIPRDLFPSPTLDAVVDARLDRGSALLLADYLFVLNRRLPELALADLPGVVEATRCLVAACAAPSRERRAEAQAPIDLTLMERARRLVRRRLAEPDLSPDTLCRELGVSRSRLYRLFEPIGGISSYIRRQRLLQARHALMDVSDTRSIVRIAEQWGFTDASTFSRAFRHEFGLSPKAAREYGRDGIGYPSRGVDLYAVSGMHSLAELLRRLGG